MTAKEKVMQVVKGLPDDASYEDVMGKLYFLGGNARGQTFTLY